MTTRGLFSFTFRAAASAIAVGLAVCVTFELAGLRINISASMPVGLYRITNDQRAKLVEFCPVEPFASLAIARGYRTSGNCPDGAAPLMKPVIAKQGDTVEISGTGIAVNGLAIPRTASLVTDTRGRPMSAWRPGRYTVGAGSIWVASSYHPRSFDSRYFGPVPLSSVRHRLEPFLTL